jgi:hypothetical protein
MKEMGEWAGRIRRISTLDRPSVTAGTLLAEAERAWASLRCNAFATPNPPIPPQTKGSSKYHTTYLKLFDKPNLNSSTQVRNPAQMKP